MVQEPGDEKDVEKALRGAVPVPPEMTPEVMAELSAMATNARTASAPSKIRGRISRGAGAGLAAVVIGGVGAAAALTGLVSGPEWMADPDTETTFAIPGGQVCTVVVGHDPSGHPELDAAIQDYFASGDLAELVDIESAIDQARRSPSVQLDEQGRAIESDDRSDGSPAAVIDYQTAVMTQILRSLDEELRGLGYTEVQLADLRPMASTTCDEAP